MKILNTFLTVVVILFTSSCSTNIDEAFRAHQKVLLESMPTGSDIYMNGEFIGKTPLSLRLRSDINHEIKFQKEGFSPTNESLSTILKYDKQPYVQLGLAKDLGYYYELSSDHIIAELHWEPLPDTVGNMPFETMSELIAKADNSLSSGTITLDEHNIVIRQIIELFNTN
jgi:hypothetical protein